MRPLTRLCFALAIALLPLASPLLTPTASASSFTVNSLGDTPDALLSDGLCADASGACTLRAAVEQANADPSGDVIGFSVAGTINLTGALPDLSKGMTINGPGDATQLTVWRNSSEPYRIFTVSSGAVVRISGLTVSNGLAPPSQGGGGVYSAGDLTLSVVVVANNNTSSPAAGGAPVAPGGGGGIQNDGLLTMTDCTVMSNHTGAAPAGTGFGGGNGGGILNNGTLNMTSCLVGDNTTGDGGQSDASGGPAGDGGAGGGIYSAHSGAQEVSATLTNCIVSGNQTGVGGTITPGPHAGSSRSGDGGDGGGIYNGSTMTVDRGYITQNYPGAGANVSAELPANAGNGGSGGGIYNDLGATGREMRVVNSVITRNTAGSGGSIHMASSSAGGDGGGIANPSADSILKVSQSDILYNAAGDEGDGLPGRGGGIYGTARLRSNILAYNQSRYSNNGDLDAGTTAGFVSSGYNYVGGCFTGCGSFKPTDLFGPGGGGGVGVDNLNLDPDTFLPLPGSVAIDAGLARDVDDHPVTADLRGAVRPFDFPAVMPQAGGDNSDIGAMERQESDPPPTPTSPTVQFTASAAHVAEGCAQAEVTITRSEPKDGTTVVVYVVQEDFPRGASERGDFTYETAGHVTFAPGEDTKTIPILLSEDAYAEGPEQFVAMIFVEEGGVSGEPNTIFLTIDDNDATDGAANPIDDNATFVGQHYHDFLSRQADPDGQAFWTAQLDACGGDAACLDRKRADVSAAFFLSIEFQNTSYFVVRVNKAAFSARPDFPNYYSFLYETQMVSRGVVVGQPGYAELLEANKKSYTEWYVTTYPFPALHDEQDAAQYVDSLFAKTGATPTQGERAAAISAFGSGDTAGRAAALRAVVESGSVYNKLYNPSLVLMQYFAYLRRIPYDGNWDGYNFWLDKLNSFTRPGEDARDERVALSRVRRAEMIRAFLLSAEYRGRFGGDPSRGNP